MAASDHKDREQKVLELVKEAAKFDDELRAQFQVGNKFRFVQDRIKSLLNHLEQVVTVPSEVSAESSSGHQVVSDEVIVYVYLYNAHGMNMRSWQKMLTPKVFDEYSVNRPIYAEKSHVDLLVKSKSNIAQHAYLAVAVKRENILSTGVSKDANGNPLVKVKERSLDFKKLMTFTHGFQDYTVDEEGELKKK
jgi:hypothetical protein